MKTYTYQDFQIVRNAFGEYNVCKTIQGRLEMVDSKARFNSLKEAKVFVDSIPPFEKAIIGFYARVK